MSTIAARIARTSLFVAIAFTSVACAGRSEMFLSADGGENNIAQSQALKQEALSHWQKRKDPAAAKAARKGFREAYKANKADKEIAGYMIRSCYYFANYIMVEQEATQEKIDEAYTQCVDRGEAAQGTINKDFRKAIKDGATSLEALKHLTAEDVPTLYWTVSSLARWAATKSLIVKLGQKDRLEKMNVRARELDPDFFYAASHRFFGALPTKVPGGDLDEARREFEEGIKKAPNYFGTRVMMAQFYATKAQDEKVYREQLQYVIDADAAVIPEIEAENYYEQKLAKKLILLAEDYFGE